MEQGTSKDERDTYISVWVACPIQLIPERRRVLSSLLVPRISHSFVFCEKGKGGIKGYSGCGIFGILVYSIHLIAASHIIIH